MRFNDVFKMWRLGLGLTQKEAAELLGICRGTYNRFEKTGLVGELTLYKLQQYYNNNRKEFNEGEANV